MLYAEASFSSADHAAILHVARRRGDRLGTSWLAALIAYSSLARSHSARARSIRALPDGDVPGWSMRENDGWRALRELTARFDADPASVADDCKRATHWGSRVLPTDHARAVRAVAAGRWAVVRCSRPTSNQFFAERGMR